MREILYDLIAKTAYCCGGLLTASGSIAESYMESTKDIPAVTKTKILGLLLNIGTTLYSQAVKKMVCGLAKMIKLLIRVIPINSKYSNKRFLIYLKVEKNIEISLYGFLF